MFVSLSSLQSFFDRSHNEKGIFSSNAQIKVGDTPQLRLRRCQIEQV